MEVAAASGHMQHHYQPAAVVWSGEEPRLPSCCVLCAYMPCVPIHTACQWCGNTYSRSELGEGRLTSQTNLAAFTAVPRHNPCFAENKNSKPRSKRKPPARLLHVVTSNSASAPPSLTGRTLGDLLTIASALSGATGCTYANRAQQKLPHYAARQGAVGGWWFSALPLP